MDLTQAAKVIGQLAVYFPRAEFGEVTVLKWAEELVAYEFADGQAAVKALARSKVHPPALSELLEACAEAREQRTEQERLSRPRLSEPLRSRHGIPREVRASLVRMGLVSEPKPDEAPLSMVERRHDVHERHGSPVESCRFCAKAG